ncbi:MAG: hypothetical protein ACI9DC_005198, partial [Gammaproteobacteria bacterium]
MFDCPLQPIEHRLQSGPSLRQSAGCDALIAWRYSVKLQKSE